MNFWLWLTLFSLDMLSALLLTMVLLHYMDKRESKRWNRAFHRATQPYVHQVNEEGYTSLYTKDKR